MRKSLSELDDLGILCAASLPNAYSWMTDADKYLLIDLLMAGESGMHRREIDKFEKVHPRTAMHVEANMCADWQTDKKGQPERLVLSPRGEDIAAFVMKVARNQSQLTAQGHPVPH